MSVSDSRVMVTSDASAKVKLKYRAYPLPETSDSHPSAHSPDRVPSPVTATPQGSVGVGPGPGTGAVAMGGSWAKPYPQVLLGTSPRGAAWSIRYLAVSSGV